MRGLFVAVEGPEGAGKSTLTERLARRIERSGATVVTVREPGGTPAAEAVRSVVLDSAMHWPPAAELFLMLAARAALVAEVIRPRLAEGAVVLTDRFELSTVAYQVAGRGLPAEVVAEANRLATGGLRPDLTLVLDVPFEVGRQRQHTAGKVPDRMEREDAGLHQRVERAFAEARGTDTVHLDGTMAADAVEAAAWDSLVTRFGETFSGGVG